MLNAEVFCYYNIVNNEDLNMKEHTKNIYYININKIKYIIFFHYNLYFHVNNAI